MSVPDPLIVIVGQTATGKSALGIELARRFDGEIICADSRTVYRGMDIGTAKPTAADQAAVPHWGLDLVPPDQPYSAAAFKAYADNTIRDIHSRGKLPIIVGGTGLYIDSVIYNYQFRPPADPALRRELAGLHTAQLQQRIMQAGLQLPVDPNNPRRLMRVLESGASSERRSELRPGTLLLGLAAEPDVLRERIVNRVSAMVAQGLVAEVTRLGSEYGWEAEALQAPAYRAFRAYSSGETDLDAAKAAFVQNDMQLAKRQRTWFQRNKSIHWLSTSDKLAEAVDITTTFLNN